MTHRMRTESYVCVDLETTGLNPKTDKIMEVGAVKVENGRIVRVYETFVNPGRPVPERVRQLTGICDAWLQSAPQMEDVLSYLLDFLGDSVLLGHQVLFDYSFIKKEAVNHKVSFERLGIDTLKIARKYLPDLESRSLDCLCRHYAIPHSPHRALQDAQAACALYDRLWEEFGNTEDAVKMFMPKPLLYQAKRDTPITPAQKERLYKLLVKHKLNIEYNLDTLTRSEASRYTDRILAKYGR